MTYTEGALRRGEGVKKLAVLHPLLYETLADVVRVSLFCIDYLESEGQILQALTRTEKVRQSLQVSNLDT